MLGAVIRLVILLSRTLEGSLIGSQFCGHLIVIRVYILQVYLLLLVEIIDQLETLIEIDVALVKHRRVVLESHSLLYQVQNEENDKGQ